LKGHNKKHENLTKNNDKLICLKFPK